MLTALNLVLGLTALAGVYWDVFTGQVGSLDGNFLALVCLLLASLFLGSFFSSLKHGGLKMVWVKSKKTGKTSKEKAAE